ncbi:hypothetical protein [Proteus mirabilis]|uniref:hypothetical protein n=1 Tax=Proteus mirabilis TaxID=584 RepID=UPI0034D50CA8
MKDVVVSVLALGLEFGIVALLSLLSATLFKLGNNKDTTILPKLTVSLISGLIFFIISIELPLDLYERVILNNGNTSIVFSSIIGGIIALIIGSILFSFLFVRSQFVKLKYMGENKLPLYVYFIFACFAPILTIILTLFNI